MPHVGSLAPLVHDEHMDGHEKCLALNMSRLKDEIQARSVNSVIPLDVYQSAREQEQCLS